MVATISAATLVVGGCGGSGDGSTGSTGTGFDVQASTVMYVANPRISKAEFIRRVEGYCRKAWPSVRHSSRTYIHDEAQSGSRKERASEAIRNSLMGSIDFQIFDNIHILGTPPGEERAIEEIVGPMQEAVERGQRLGPLYSIAEVTALFGKFNRQASRYGLRDCLVEESHLGI
jgi:hypothetical protein